MAGITGHRHRLGFGIFSGKIGILAGGMPLCMVFWQMALSIFLTLVIARLQGQPVPMDRQHIRNYLIVSVLASSIPSICLMFAVGQVPAGVVSITIAIVPMLTYALAFGLGRERQSLVRLAGPFCGIGAILLLVLPEASLLERSAVPWILVAAIAPTCHALNNINLSRPVMTDIHPLHIIFGANLVGAMTLLPLALATGNFLRSLNAIWHAGMDDCGQWGNQRPGLSGLYFSHSAGWSGFRQPDRVSGDDRRCCLGDGTVW